MERSRILFCDYDGNFELADRLSLSGYLVDQIRPDGLRGVAVGDHAVYFFVFQSESNCPAVLRICEKLKSAELLTPIVVVKEGDPIADFENHAKCNFRADFYLQGGSLETQVFKVLQDKLHLHAQDFTDSTTQALVLNPRIENDLLERIKQLEEALYKSEQEIERLKQKSPQGEDLRPKLEEMLQGEKKKAQTETERLKVRLSEIEAKLLDREARLKEVDRQRENIKRKALEMKESFEKAQSSLRDFYMKKIKELETRLGMDSGFAGGGIAEEKTIMLEEPSLEQEKTEIHSEKTKKK